MCEVCGDPNCKAFGTKISDLELTEDSNALAEDIFGLFEKLCMMLDDETGLKQLDQIKSHLMDEQHMRYDEIVLYMFNSIVKAIALKKYQLEIQKRMQEYAEQMAEEQEEEVVDPTFNKNLN